MTERIWEDLLTERDKQVISKAGYDEGGAASWDSRGLGDNPLVMVIDMQRLIVGENVPILEAVEEYQTAMGEVAWNAMEDIAGFLDVAREHDIPVMYTRVVPTSYDDPDHPDLDIVDPVAPEPGETVIDKSYASAFY
ncbi:MAG: isochorismatase family protein, partial [Salinirussus sp.]